MSDIRFAHRDRAVVSAQRRSYGERVSRAGDRDACPGALQVHQAADGALARVRLPGGMVSAAQLHALARIAVEFGSPAMELTSRGNIQIRGITDTGAVAEAVAAAGLLPSATHERVRNIVASPLSGRVGGHVDIRHWVTRLDNAIRAAPGLAALPGRFWFGIDDGRGDVSGLGTDVGAHLLGADFAALLLAGRDTGVRLAPHDVVPTLIAVAERFAARRGKTWRVAELADTAVLLNDAAGRKDLVPDAGPGVTWAPSTRPPVGWIEQHDGRVALGAAVPLGVLQATVGESLAAIGAPLVITPWRSVLVFDLDEGVADAALRVLAPLGLVFDEGSPWLDVSACTGSPGCQHSAADVRADAALAVARGVAGTRRHFVGCERACGRPPAGEVLVATGKGYRAKRSSP
jgi:precorrin-3B synthase